MNPSLLNTLGAALSGALLTGFLLRLLIHNHLSQVKKWGEATNQLRVDIAVIKEKIDGIKDIKENVVEHEVRLAIVKERVEKAERDINATHQKIRAIGGSHG